ncbi:hypothetical protein DUI87_34401 [Hirundo rustica rustica]|uniref:Reverse transcriptase domain-containing protein n=1 Tax=Hirundo rustica rustica TaxID=333673 RepID=A0A3M0II99_HIRRU|nr:hypothetical protein DUI87_34401 [Hirundo rustica rustica]
MLVREEKRREEKRREEKRERREEKKRREEKRREEKREEKRREREEKRREEKRREEIKFRLVISGLIQIIQYVDNLLLSGEDEVKVREATIKLLNFLGEKGLRVSKGKLQFVEPEVKYPGHLIITSLLEKVQRLLNVKDTTFLVFHLVTFLYMVYIFSIISHTLLNTVRQQIEAREQRNKSVTQAAAKPDSEAKTPAVAAVKKGKKHTDKTNRPVNDDSGERSSMPPDTQSGVKPPDTQSEAEATDDTQSEAKPTDTKSEAKSTGTRSRVQPTSTRSGAQPAATTSKAQPTAARAGARPTAARARDTIESFSLKDLRGLKKDYTRRPDKSIIS